MRNLVLIMLALIAVPSFAAPAITVSSTDAGVVTVGYTTDDANEIAGFGLAVSLSGDAVIVADSFVDMQDAGSYTIHPNNIVITNGAIAEVGSAIYSKTDQTMVVEFGALHEDGVDVPATTGTLFTFTVDKDCTVTVSSDTVQGGVVTKGAVIADTGIVETEDVEFASASCLGDGDGDGDVDFVDFGLFRNAYGASSSDGNYNADCDLDSDGDVDFVDFGLFRNVYGTSC